MIAALPEQWRQQLDKLSMDTETQSEPSGETQPWHQVFMSFATHGFEMVYLSAQGDGVHARLECALPAQTSQSAFRVGLLKQLESYGAKNPHLSAEGPPSIFYTTFSQEVTETDIAAFLTLCLKISDYIKACEDNPNAPLPFAQAAPEEQDTSDDEGQNTGSTQFVFEAIGSGEPTPEDAQEEDKKEPAATNTPSFGGAFETIGTGKPEPKDDAASTLSEDLQLKAYHVSKPDGDMVARLTLTETIDGASRDQLTRGFIKNLEVRYDVRISALREARADEIELRIEPASRHLPLREEDREDLESYFDRLVRFGKMGVSLRESLDLKSPGTTHRKQTSESSARTTLVDIPSKRQAQQDEQEVVLDLGSSSNTPEDGDPLESKRYDDPRIKRPDATTPLVDVVLRHPGYSDKRIGQVLSILLSIDYSRALELIEDAPCVISWGISRERALTFKNAIEGAGGRAVLVEPGTFKTT